MIRLRVWVCMTTRRWKKNKQQICSVSMIYCAYCIIWCLKRKSNCSERRWTDFYRLSCFICFTANNVLTYSCMIGTTIITTIKIHSIFQGLCGMRVDPEC